MADIRIRDLPNEPTPSGTDFTAIDGASTRKTTLTLAVQAGRPTATQAEAEAGTDPIKAMTPLTVSQAISFQVTGAFVPQSRTITAGTGLTGGGNLSANRTLALNSTSIASLALADTSVQPSRTINTGAGLLGGGNLSADRTLTVTPNLASLSGLSLTAGDILYATGASTLQRLPIGTSNQALTVVSGAPAWTALLGTGNVVGPASATDGAIALFSGTTGKFIQNSTPAGVRDLLDAPIYVTSRTAMKAIDTTSDQCAILLEGRRSGYFKWTLGNFSTQVTADTSEGIYVKANAISSAVGAWVRVFDGGYYITWWGAVGDGVTNDYTAIQAAVNFTLFSGGGCLNVPASTGDYICNSTVVIDIRPFAQRYSGAMQLVGEGPRRSCIRSNSISAALFSYIGDLTTDESHFRIENIRITGNVASPVSGSMGLSLNAAAWMTFDRCDIEGFDTGITAVDIDQIGFYNCNIRFNNRGITAAVLTFTYFNSWTFVNTLLAGNSLYGAYFKNANGLTYIGGSIQGNGLIGAGAGSFGVAVEESGGPGAAYGNILFAGTEFESNGGLGDFVSIQTANPAQISFQSVAFFRSVPPLTGVIGAANNGSGLIRLTTSSSTSRYTTGTKIFVSGVGGVTNANGEWTVTVIDGTHLDLQGSTFAGSYTSGGNITNMGYGTNNIYTTGSNAQTTYKISGCTFVGGSPYVPSASRPTIGFGNAAAKWSDDGTNYFANAVEAPAWVDASLLPLGSKSGAWTATTPTVTAQGTAGAFAATASLKTLRLGKLVNVQLIVTITNIGTATGFTVPFPVAPTQNTFITGGGLSNVFDYKWASTSGAVFKYDGTSAPVAQIYSFSGSYETT